MRLYAVLKRETISALRAGRALNYAESLVLDDGHGDHQGTVRVPSPTFYHFPWLCDLMEEDPSPGWESWAQIALDVPDDVAASRESRCPEGGNSTWHLPLDLVARLAKEQADAAAADAPGRHPGRA
jgi:hypothetical protein